MLQGDAASYNAAFAKFFQRLADDGITPSNTVFMFSAEEGDHFAGANVGRSIQPNCTGTPGTIDYTCSYARDRRLGTDRRAVSQHPRAAEEPARQHDPVLQRAAGQLHLHHGEPGPTDPTTRQLERDFGNAQVFDSYDNATENLTQYEVDPAVEQLCTS